MKRTDRLLWLSLSGGLLLMLLSLLTACAGNTVATPEPLPLPTLTPTPRPIIGERPLRLFLVGSYGADDPLSKEFRAGLLDTLDKALYRPGRMLELREAYLDSVRDVGGYRARVPGLLAEIVAYQPDVLIVCDDEAMTQVLTAYPDPEQWIVFCGLDGEVPEAVKTLPHVAGVLEERYPVQTVRLARAMMPNARSYVLLTDDSVETRNAIQRWYADIAAANLEGMYMPPLRQVEKFEYWQRVVMTETVNYNFDFILLGNYHALRDAAGNYIPEDDVLKWTLTHTPVPVYALQQRSVEFGAIGGLVVSRRAQGEQVGAIVVKMMQGVAPETLGIVPSSPNPLLLNLAAAQYWRLGIPVKIPVTGKLYRTLLASPGGQR